MKKHLFPGSDIPLTRAQACGYAKHIATLPPDLVPVPEEQWPVQDGAACRGAWVSRRYCVVAWQEPEDRPLRISINRTKYNPSTGQWRDGITWDEIQAIKRDIGLGDRWAAEAYPPDDQMVDVACLRHIWILDDEPDWAWTA